MIVKLCAFLALFLVHKTLEQNLNFRQNTYSIVHEKLEITEVNKTAVLHPHLKLFSYNTSLSWKAVNGSAYFTPGIYKNMLINAALFRFAKNAYRPFPINITMDGCEEIKGTTPLIKNAVDHSNLKSCPCPPGEYYIYNFLIEEDKFPPHLPYGKYKLVINVKIDDNIFLGRGNWFGSIAPKTNS